MVINIYDVGRLTTSMNGLFDWLIMTIKNRESYVQFNVIHHIRSLNGFVTLQNNKPAKLLFYISSLPPSS